jgi:hypothetical protein
MSFEFYANIPKLPPIRVNDIVDTLVQSGLCLLNKFENDKGFLRWANQIKTEDWPDTIRIWIDTNMACVALDGNGNQMELLIWELEKFLSNFYNSPIVFEDL